jgi:hypothetical protein
MVAFKFIHGSTKVRLYEGTACPRECFLLSCIRAAFSKHGTEICAAKRSVNHPRA